MTPPVPGYIAWWDASQITGVADGATLQWWYDLTANHFDLSQGWPNNRPVYHSSGSQLINGLPVVSFTADIPGGGTNDQFLLNTNPALLFGQPFSIVLVCQPGIPPGGSGNPATVFSAGLPSDWPNSVQIYQSTASTAVAANVGQIIGATDTTAPHFIGWSASGAASIGQYDASVSNPINPGNVGLNGQVLVGNLGGNSVGNGYTGRICEIVIYGSVLTTGELAGLYTYLRNKWIPVVPPATITIGPLSVTSSGTVSGTGTTITGSAVLNLGPFTVTARTSLETLTATAGLTLGPLLVAALSGRTGPGAHPVPGWRGRWRLTLHTRKYGPATLNSTIIAELTDARGRQLVQAWNQPATLTFILDGRSQPALLVQELTQEVVAWRWDDQTGIDQPVFRGVIAQSEDQITADSHTVTYICHDYGAVLARRLIRFTYTATARDQDLIVGDLLAQAQPSAYAPASFLPLSLWTANPDGTLRGLSGRVRDRTYYGSQNIGTALDDLAKIIDGFDWDVKPSATDTTDSLRIFYPTPQGVPRPDVTLQYGSTIAGFTRTVNSADYANYIRVLGNNSSSSPTPQLYAEAQTTDAASSPAGLWMLGDDAADVTQVQTLLEKAQGDINLYSVLVPHYTLTLAPDAYTWGHPNMGDTIGLILQTGRLNVATLPPAGGVRVLGITFDIGDDGQEDVALIVSRPPVTLGHLFLKNDQNITALARR
jgi:hypothetical protein